MKSLLLIIIGVVIVSGDREQQIRDEIVKTLKIRFAGMESIFMTNLISDCTKVKYLLRMLYPRVKDNDEVGDLLSLKLRLYHQNGTTAFDLTMGGKEILKNPFYNVRLPTIIFIHGFTTEITGQSVTSSAESLRDRGEMNVIDLDTSAVILEFYLKAQICVSVIGKMLGKILIDLYNDGTGVNPDSIRIIGHSLGTHIAGFAGKHLKKLTGMTLGRITGLDPAGPCFFKKTPELWINSSDAKFVDIVHTDSEDFGVSQPLGHIDFYPNNGTAQPNCPRLGCSHSRSWELYAESIMNGASFLATACLSWKEFLAEKCSNNSQVNMGYTVPLNARGKYYLKTSGIPPFDMSQAGSNSRNSNILIILLACLLLNL